MVTQIGMLREYHMLHSKMVEDISSMTKMETERHLFLEKVFTGKDVWGLTLDYCDYLEKQLGQYQNTVDILAGNDAPRMDV